VEVLTIARFRSPAIADGHDVITRWIVESRRAADWLLGLDQEWVEGRALASSPTRSTPVVDAHPASRFPGRRRRSRSTRLQPAARTVPFALTFTNSLDDLTVVGLS
jgi:hypothetical protein